MAEDSSVYESDEDDDLPFPPSGWIGMGLAIGIAGGIAAFAGAPFELALAIWALGGVVLQIGIIAIGVSVGMRDARTR